MCGMCPCREGPQSFLPWLVEQEMGAGGGVGGHWLPAGQLRLLRAGMKVQKDERWGAE